MSPLLLAISFLAGALTGLAPCTLPLLPLILKDVAQPGSRRRTVILLASLGISIVAVTLLLKFFAVASGASQTILTQIAGGFILLVGLTMIFPTLREKMKFSVPAAKSSKSGVLGDILTGALLGPTFNSCSPTYFLILGVVLPASLGAGIGYLTAYTLGLLTLLGLIAIFGRKITRRLGVVADSHSLTKKILGILILVIGALLLTGHFKTFEAFLVQNGITISPTIDRSLRETFRENFDDSEIPQN